MVGMTRAPLRLRGFLSRPFLPVRRGVLGAALLVVGWLLVAAPPVAAATHIVSYLDAEQVVPGPGDADAFAYLRLQIDPAQGVVCVTWTFIDIAPTAAQVHSGQEAETGPAVVDLPIDSDECTPEGLDGPTLQAILDDPESYYVEVQSEEFPEGGAIRGQIGTEEVTDLFVVNYGCPPTIQSEAELNAAGGADACQVAIDESDLGSTPEGQPYIPEPILFDLRLVLTDAIRDTYTELEPEGGTTCDETMCRPPAFVYRFVDDLRQTSQMLAGETTIEFNSDADVYRLALVRVTDEESGPITVDQVDPTGTAFDFDTAGTDQVAVRVFYFVGDDPNPVGPGATIPPTSTLDQTPPSDGGPGAMLAALIAGIVVLVIRLMLAVPRRRTS
jgi:hypothetical protein